jgi:hypothetical protein
LRLGGGRRTRGQISGSIPIPAVLFDFLPILPDIVSVLVVRTFVSLVTTSVSVREHSPTERLSYTFS